MRTKKRKLKEHRRKKERDSDRGGGEKGRREFRPQFAAGRMDREMMRRGRVRYSAT
jgi:hypothetical protein